MPFNCIICDTYFAKTLALKHNYHAFKQFLIKPQCVHIHVCYICVFFVVLYVQSRRQYNIVVSSSFAFSIQLPINHNVKIFFFLHKMSNIRKSLSLCNSFFFKCFNITFFTSQIFKCKPFCTCASSVFAYSGITTSCALLA